MTCDVCLEETFDVINIFNEEGIRLKIPSIIRQHFWFEPRENDPTLSRICKACWAHIVNFHIFYTSVKEAHEKLKSDDYGNAKSDGSGEIYTVVDSDDEGSNENYYRIDNVTGAPQEIVALDVEDNAELKEIKTEMYGDGLAEGARQFILQEHEALLNEYTYIEPSVKDLVRAQDGDEGTNNFTNMRNDPFSKVVSPASHKFINDPKGINSKFQPNHFAEDKTFANEDALILKYIKLECDLCFIRLETFNELNAHYQATHQMSGYVRCCDKKLPTRSYILDHINQHINPDNYTCKECDKSFSTQYAIKNHLAMIHPPESSKIYKCQECPKRFTNDYSLNKHILQHKNEDEKRLYCTDCGKMFCSTLALEKHRSVHHKRMSGHICHVCGVVLKGKKAFGKHIREHAAILGTEAINDPVCPLCGKLSASIKTLRHHIRYVHSAMRPHKCPVCGKGFKIRQKLKEHLGTHAVGVSLPCPYCPKRFRSKIHVYSHKYRMHKKEYDMERNARLEAAANGTYRKYELTDD